MKSTADMVVSALVHSPFDQMSLHELKRVDAQIGGAYVALLTHGYTPLELMPLQRMLVKSTREIESRYCRSGNAYHDYV